MPNGQFSTTNQPKSKSNLKLHNRSNRSKALPPSKKGKKSLKRQTPPRSANPAKSPPASEERPRTKQQRQPPTQHPDVGPAREAGPPAATAPQRVPTGNTPAPAAHFSATPMATPGSAHHEHQVPHSAAVAADQYSRSPPPLWHTTRREAAQLSAEEREHIKEECRQELHSQLQAARDQIYADCREELRAERQQPTREQIKEECTQELWTQLRAEENAYRAQTLCDMQTQMAATALNAEHHLDTLVGAFEHEGALDEKAIDKALKAFTNFRADMAAVKLGAVQRHTHARIHACTQQSQAPAS
mmetsp:Transcript_68356/g.189988  ORF Transcript_68356/g.189988 Transcript_68356/m.189988 type:complete len:302 (+) Transcript_68356:1079-1984(+)